jgi:tetratricopeptide (TPR) repeat protein
MKLLRQAAILVIVAVILNAAVLTWAYRSPPVSFFGYLFFIPGRMDAREIAYRLGWKKIPPAQKDAFRSRRNADPADAEAAFVLGYYAYRERRLDEAVANFELAIKNGFPQPKVHYWLARACAESGRRDRARKEYDQVMLKLGFPYLFRLALQLDIH